MFELLGSCLVIPIAEELLFRGVVYKRLKLYFGVTPALIGSALIFGIMHVNLVQFLYAAVIGLLLAFVLEKQGSFPWQFWAYCGKSCGGAADGDRMAGVQFLSDGKRHFVYGCDGSGRNSRCQPFYRRK